ncbi:hypothetical protein CK203_084797 [Vitis vinifera]|uniref:MICOS complex subunit MIC10 n=1 Tax=Vitis vinifera TaxID=29760 RepID=A0A438BVN8_VITVI|nr:hypothetical protein CK203_084797 [Vitis vinifera]
MSGSPVTRWASVAFGAGLGLGSAYTECSQKFGGYPAMFLPPKISDAPASQVSLVEGETVNTVRDMKYNRTWKVRVVAWWNKWTRIG